MTVPVGEMLSVWATGQASPAVQRRGRYVPESSAHPAKMLPAVAAHAITHYTRPGELVLDPMCGIGTTLVEAVHRGRRAVGVEYETRWAQLARANLDLAGPGRAGAGQVITGDARHLDWLLPAAAARTGGVDRHLAAVRAVHPRPGRHRPGRHPQTRPPLRQPA